MCLHSGHNCITDGEKLCEMEQTNLKKLEAMGLEGDASWVAKIESQELVSVCNDG